MPQAIGATELYKDVSLKNMFEGLFGGGEGSLSANMDPQSFDAMTGPGAPSALPQTATPAGALPVNAPVASTQGALPGNGQAQPPSQPATQQPPASASPVNAASPPNKKEMVEQEVARAQSGAKQHPKQAEQMAEALEGSGVDLMEAYNELFEQLGGEVKPKTELTKQEKGLFVMSFGLRMMAASETMSAGGAFGVAGAQTAGEMQGLQQSRAKTARDVTKERREGALQILRERVGQQEGALERASRERLAGPQTYDAASGLRQFNPDTRQWDQQNDPQTGQPIRPGMTPGGHTKPFAHRDKLDMLLELNYSEQEAATIIAGGEPNEVLYTKGQDAFAKMKDSDRVAMPDGRVLRKREMTDEDQDAWIRNRIKRTREITSSMNRGESALQSARGGAPGAPGAQGAGQPQQPQRVYTEADAAAAGVSWAGDQQSFYSQPPGTEIMTPGGKRTVPGR